MLCTRNQLAAAIQNDHKFTTNRLWRYKTNTQLTTSRNKINDNMYPISHHIKTLRKEQGAIYYLEETLGEKQGDIYYLEKALGEENNVCVHEQSHPPVKQRNSSDETMERENEWSSVPSKIVLKPDPSPNPYPTPILLRFSRSSMYLKQKAQNKPQNTVSIITAKNRKAVQ